MEKRKSENGTQIVRQSSLKLVLEHAQTCNRCLSLKELAAITNVMVDFVEYGYSKEIGDRFDKIEEHLKNK